MVNLRLILILMYNTKQKTQLIKYLKTQKEPMSATEIANNLKEIGKSTVFRLLKTLEEERIIQSFTENRIKFYIFRPQCCHEHIHASCIKCGRFIHLDSETSLEIEKAMKKSGLLIESDQIIQCICDKCRSSEN